MWPGVNDLTSLCHICKREIIIASASWHCCEDLNKLTESKVPRTGPGLLRCYVSLCYHYFWFHTFEPTRKSRVKEPRHCYGNNSFIHNSIDRSFHRYLGALQHVASSYQAFSVCPNVSWTHASPLRVTRAFFLNIVDTFGTSAQLKFTPLPKHASAHPPAAVMGTVTVSPLPSSRRLDEEWLSDSSWTKAFFRS